jgi:DNA repair protein RadC
MTTAEKRRISGAYVRIARVLREAGAGEAVREAEAAYGAQGVPASRDGLPVRRLLSRLGLLRSSRDGKAARERLGALCDAVAGEQGVPARAVLAALWLYGGGRRGEWAVCGRQPDCHRCPLRPACAYRGRLTMKQLPEDARPRERLLRHGAASLADHELLAIVLRTGRPGEKVLDLAARILNEAGDLNTLAEWRTGELTAVRGVGRAKAAEILAALELSSRVRKRDACVAPGVPIRGSADVVSHYRGLFARAKKERFYAVLLDNKHRIVREARVSEGSLTSSIVHPRETFREAVREAAAAVIFVHNHPSGDPEPSREDLEITRRLKEAGELMGIRVLDHIIIGGGGHVSLADRGCL